MKYQGSCHCQAVQFEIDCDEITQALQCNCSICIRKNAIMSKQLFSPSEFTLLTGSKNLSTYRWGDEEVNHYFCKTCGVYPFHDTSLDPGMFRVNLGCVNNIESRALEITSFDGRNML